MSKFKFSFAENTFTLPSKEVSTIGWNGKETIPTIDARPAIAGKLIKQFVKSNYPGVVCSVKSASFSMGNSLDVWVTNPDGSEIGEDAFEAIRAFASKFKMGRFCGMTDSYEYDKSVLKTTCGVKIDPCVKYLSTNKRPQYGSVEDAIRRFNGEGEAECVKMMDYNNFSDAKRRKVAAYIASK
jgi:hypothetical protein